MKIFTILIFSIICASSIAHRSNNCNNCNVDDDEMFLKHLKKFNITLAPCENYEEHKAVFLSKYQEVQQHNTKFLRGLETYEMELNEFSHMYEGELVKNLLGVKNLNNFKSKCSLAEKTSTSIPIAWNWIDHNILQPIQKQKLCGSSYAFGAIAEIEAQMALKYGKSEKLSEQEGMDCTNGCNGGSPYMVMQYSSKNEGLTSESSYPYYARSLKSCSRVKMNPRVANSQVKSICNAKNPLTEDSIKYYVYTNGPLLAIVDVQRNFFSYSRGIYSGNVNATIGKQAVLIVGYGGANNISYWIIRNSW